MLDFLNEKTYYLGIIKGRPHFLSYYYQIFGANNDLQIELNGQKQAFICPVRNKKSKIINIPDNIFKYLVEAGCLDNKPIQNQTSETNTIENYKKKSVPSGLERFKKKYPNLIKVNNTKEEDQPSL